MGFTPMPTKPTHHMGPGGTLRGALGGSKLKNRVFLNGFAGSRYGFFIDFNEVLGYLGVDLRAASVSAFGLAI